jgi:hypothetical protein
MPGRGGSPGRGSLFIAEYGDTMAENGPLWEALNDIRERITRMEASLESYTGQISERCMIRSDRLDAVERRLSEMEKQVWKMIGASSVISAITTAVIITALQRIR